MPGSRHCGCPDRLRSSPDANVGCSDGLTYPADTISRLRSSPDANVGCSSRTRRPGASQAVAILTRRERRVQPVGGVGAGSAGLEPLRSSPDANVGCSRAMLAPIAVLTDGVAILTRRERRVQPAATGRPTPPRRALRSSPDANVGCSGQHPSAQARLCRGCDPHPTRTSGAAAQPRQGTKLTGWRLRSSPDANVGCSQVARVAGCRTGPVAILTRRERRVQPCGGCSSLGGSRQLVAILTRRERRVQPASGGTLVRRSPRRVAILTRRERRVQRRRTRTKVRPRRERRVQHRPGGKRGGGGRGCGSSPTRTSGAASTPTAAHAPSTTLRSSPTRTSGAAAAGRGAGGRAVRCDPHRRERWVQRPSPRSAPGGLRRLRSSPDANVGCSDVGGGAHRVASSGCDPHPTRTSGAAAAGRAAGGRAVRCDPHQRRRVQRPSLGRHPEGYAGCDPHPTRTSGAATTGSAHKRGSVAKLRSSPDANVGCSLHPSHPDLAPRKRVAILTRRERRVQPGNSVHQSHAVSRLRSSPTRTSGQQAGARAGAREDSAVAILTDANVGCSLPAHVAGLQRRGVAILTRRERRVQRSAPRPRPPAGQRCDPHRRATSGAAMPTATPAEIPHR